MSRLTSLKFTAKHFIPFYLIEVSRFKATYTRDGHKYTFHDPIQTDQTDVRS